MSSIEVTIDRIVLSGFDAASREALVTGLRQELARLFSGPGAYAERTVPLVQISGLTFEPGNAAARRLGIGVGHAIGKAAR